MMSCGNLVIDELCHHLMLETGNGNPPHYSVELNHRFIECGGCDVSVRVEVTMTNSTQGIRPLPPTPTASNEPKNTLPDTTIWYRLEMDDAPWKTRYSCHLFFNGTPIIDLR